MGGWRTLVSAAATLLLLTTTTGQAVACRKPDVYPNGDDISRPGIHDVVVRAELIEREKGRIVITAMFDRMAEKWR